MINHPNRSKLSYSSAAPVFSDADHMADIIGSAKTAAEAVEIYTRYFEGTGETRAIKAIKACPECGKDGSVDGWVPEFQA